MCLGVTPATLQSAAKQIEVHPTQACQEASAEGLAPTGDNPPSTPTSPTHNSFRVSSPTQESPPQN